jgi:hypothetical protein
MQSFENELIDLRWQYLRPWMARYYIPFHNKPAPTLLQDMRLWHMDAPPQRPRNIPSSFPQRLRQRLANRFQQIG